MFIGIFAKPMLEATLLNSLQADIEKVDIQVLRFRTTQNMSDDEKLVSINLG